MLGIVLFFLSSASTTVAMNIVLLLSFVILVVGGAVGQDSREANPSSKAYVAQMKKLTQKVAKQTAALLNSGAVDTSNQKAAKAAKKLKQYAKKLHNIDSYLRNDWDSLHMMFL